MIGRSPIRNKSEMIFPQKAEPYRKLEKSYTRIEGIQRTPSIQNINPYLDRLEAKSTDKKPAYKASYQAPVLMEQNKTLLAQNREMALLIHQRNLQIQALEKKYSEKTEGEEQLFREIEAQKQRFVGQVIRHKELTEQQILSLQAKIRDLEDQKIDTEQKMSRNHLQQQEQAELQTRKELEKLNAQYQENLALLQAEKIKLKTELEQKTNQLQVLEMEHKQKIEVLKYDAQKAREEAKHSDHLRKLETAEIKHFYQNKIQQMTLDHRRDKDLLLREHQTQMKKRDEELEKRRKEKEAVEEMMKQRERQLKTMMMEQLNEKDRVLQQMEAEIEALKLQMVKDKQTLNGVFDTQQEVLQSTSREQISAIVQQNNSLTQLMEMKNAEIKRLYSQIDCLRDRYCAELQQDENRISDLISKMYTSEIGNEEEKELLKRRLAVLRQTDLKSFKDYYDHQIQALADHLQEKDTIIIANRSKMQEELRKKDELRKRYELENARQKQEALKLNSKIKLLESSKLMESKEQAVKVVQTETVTAKSAKMQEKLQNIRQEEVVSLQEIIKAKDLEIEQLQQKIELLKSNQTLELQQKDNQILSIRKEQQAAFEEKDKKIKSLEIQLGKAKAEMKKEKENYLEEKKNLDERRRQGLKQASEQAASAKNLYDAETVTFQNEIRKLTLQISKLENDIQNSQKEKDLLVADFQQIQIVNGNRQKEMLQEFFSSQLRLKEEEIVDLRQRNAELCNDIIDARENYASLEKKLESLIESQSSLREIERKVMHLGKENNLVKNKKEALSVRK